MGPGWRPEHHVSRPSGNASELDFVRQKNGREKFCLPEIRVLNPLSSTE